MQEETEKEGDIEMLRGRNGGVTGERSGEDKGRRRWMEEEMEVKIDRGEEEEVELQYFYHSE